MFLKYSTSQIPSKKSRGKGSQGKKTVDTPVTDVDVSEESDSELARKRIASRRVVKKKVIISAVDNIIPDPDVALKLGKSISLTKAAEEEAARQGHATHARIPKPATSKLKLKGVQSLTPKEQEAADIMQALKESNKTSRRQPGTRGSSEELVFHQGFQMSPQLSLLPQEKELSENSKEDERDDEEVDWIYSDEEDEKKDDAEDDKSIDLEMTDDEETDYDDEEDTDVGKTNARNIKEVKDDAKKVELPPTSSSLSLRVAKLEKDVSELKKIDHSAEALATLKSQVPTVVEHYLGSKIGDDLQKKPTIDLEQEYEKSASEISKIKREQAEKQKMPKYTIKSPTRQHLKTLIEDENAIDKGVADTVKNHKRQYDDDDDDDDEDP
ncbi:hypothetical protein Tco_1209700 [Tanacetum coccineum]